MHSTLAIRRVAAAAGTSNNVFTLASGAQIPKIGFGTWKLNRDEAHSSVTDALKTGFRHIDSAWAYKNEDATGRAIQQSGIPRKDLFITSKLWNSFHGDNVEMGLDASLRELGTDYLDLYLMHWPVAFSNPKNSELSSLKSQDGRPIENHILSADIMKTWRNLEEMVKKGKVRNIGISNFNIRRVEELLASADILPATNQVEVNYGVPNDELLHYCEAHQIKIQAYSPLGSSEYVEEYSQDPIIQDVAQRNNMTPAQAVLAWHLARGINPITRSRNVERMQESLAATELELPWADVQHLLKEAENKPIQRVVDPTVAWNVKEDIFEDGTDQTRLLSLKTDSIEVSMPHEAGVPSSSGSSHYLEPRNAPDSENKPNETVARFHTLSGGRTNGTRGSTVIQQLMQRRGFSSSRIPRATSSFLSSTSKQALATSGLEWSSASAQTGESRETRKMNMCTAICNAQALALASDETAVVLGEDIAFGGVFRAAAGLREQFGEERVFNTPLCEQGIAGLSIGLAAMGHRAIAEIQFADYLFPAFDQIVNEAAKLRYRSGSQTNAGGLTIRTPCQAVGHGGLYHSQSIEQFLLPVPGLNVVMPRGPITAKGLLLAAIRSPDPTIVLEPKTLYRSSVEEVPTGDYSIAIGQADVLRKGSDITLISWGAPLYTCLEAMDLLRNPPEKLQHLVPYSLREASVELVDLQTISPWDRRTVVESVKKTGRCIIVSEAPVTGSVSSEVASVIQKEAFLRLEAPVLCLGGWDTPFPHIGETFYKPNAVRILDGILETMRF